MDLPLTADGATAALGDLLVVNNTWGRGAYVAEVDYVQRADLLPEGVRFAWDWPTPARRRVLAYPSLLAGINPWREGPEHPALPMPLERALAGLTVEIDAAREGEGFNIALDLWLAATPDPGPRDARHEIMVWLSQGEGRPAGAPVAEIRIDDATWTLWLKDAPHGGGWSYAALVAEAETLTATLDLAALLRAVDAHRPFDDGLWLTAVEIGAEITGGAGAWTARTFRVTAE